MTSAAQTRAVTLVRALGRVLLRNRQKDGISPLDHILRRTSEKVSCQE